MPFQAGRIQGNYRKMVMVSVYGKLEDLGVLPDLDGIGPATGIALPVPYGYPRCRVPLQTHEKRAQLDPEEWIRTVRYGSYANLGSA